MTTIERWAEVHRLAVAGREPVIARLLGRVLKDWWLPRSRLVNAMNLARLTLTLGPDASSLYPASLSSIALVRALRTHIEQAARAQAEEAWP
ncbi:hypothetical protein Aca07nite_69000 [Actinoplanes capillaceus]|uniref:Uncharacterized protein n=1 Tax=Actinoplanes campanulatus TaxID=113559 RepID=A0ABQ3WTP7_9ACTN|nr:hypothetical protein [Actinoplanes capillaceus]GID49625.1 hypothetical protein Aca07nite_69000 [Actinoplanes capillaceus]